jgi:NADH-quinone oxidoreductase subunit A
VNSRPNDSESKPLDLAPTSSEGVLSIIERSYEPESMAGEQDKVNWSCLANYFTSYSRSKVRFVTLADYLPIGIMLFLAAAFVAVSLVTSRLVSPNRPTPEKLEPYECGIVPVVEPSQRFPVKFYLVAMLFVIFDVEIIFLFAWASIWTELGWYGVAAIFIFTFFVVETLAYVWKRGALDWNVKRRARYIETEIQEAA